jgi:PhzF family phenazine biosynthesis protein
MADAAALARLEPDFAAVAEMCEARDMVGYYAFARDAQHAASQAITRMFAPRYDIDEEFATGTAAGPLACCLYDRAGERRDVMQIEQGQLMAPPSPSVLTARLQLASGVIAGVYVGGRGSVGAELQIELQIG